MSSSVLAGKFFNDDATRKMDGDIIINTIAIANAKFLPRIEVYRKIIYEAFEFFPKGKQISFHHIKR